MGAGGIREGFDSAARVGSDRMSDAFGSVAELKGEQ